MQKEIYLISGLGADRRVFENIALPNFCLHHIEWIEPLKDESIESYAKRLAVQIKTANPILIGVSFGGVIATEISKAMPTEKIILISSVYTKKNLPLLYRTFGKSKLISLLPSFILKNVNWLTYWYFGVTTKKEKELLKAIVADTNIAFLRWAIDQICHWQNLEIPINATTIHGTRDRILPLRKADFTVDDGGHLMILNKSREINRLLTKLLAT